MLADRVTYSNINNPNYFLNFNFHYTSEVFLIDFETSKIHYFSNVRTKKDGDEYLNFKYVFTEPLTSKIPKSFENLTFTYDEMKSDSISKTIRITIYNPKKKKNRGGTLLYELEVRKFESDLFPLFRMSCMHPFELLNKLKVPGNWIVTSAKQIRNDREYMNSRLVTFKEVDFALVVPTVQVPAPHK